MVGVGRIAKLVLGMNFHDPGQGSMKRVSDSDRGIREVGCCSGSSQGRGYEAMVNQLPSGSESRVIVALPVGLGTTHGE